MAEEKIELTPQELQQVESLLEPLAQEGTPFFPMDEHFKSDMVTVDKALEPIEGEGETPATATDQPDDFTIGQDTAPSDTDTAATDFSMESTEPADADTSFDSTPAADGSDFSFDSGSESPDSTFDFGDAPAASEGAALEADAAFDMGTGEPAAMESETPSDTGFEMPSDSDSADPFAEPATSDFDAGSFDAGDTSDFASPDAGSDVGFDDAGTPALDSEITPTDSFADPGDSFGDAFSGSDTTDFGGEIAAEPTDSEIPSADFGGDDAGMGFDAPAASDTGFDMGLDSETPGSTGGDFDHAGSFDDSTGAAGFDPGSFDMSDGLEGSAEAAELPSATAEATDDLGGLDAGGFDTEGLGDVGTGAVDAGELADMGKQAALAQGIGDDFTDEDLAKIRDRLEDIPPALKKAVVQATVDEKISRPDQQLLMHMLIDQASPDAIADFLEPRVGYRPDLAPPQFRKDGVQIIYADGMSPEELAGKRKRVRLTLFAIGGAFIGIAFLFGGLLLYKRFSIKGQYEKGLVELAEAATSSGDVKEDHRKRAEAFYQQALAASGKFDPEMMSRYGLASLRAGLYEDAFNKLFGDVEPKYDWSAPGVRAPLIRLAEKSKFPSPSEFAKGQFAEFRDRDNATRILKTPGAFTVNRLRDNIFEKGTLLALGRFHSHNAGSFQRLPEGQHYKNDELAIDYYKLILTLMEMPDDVDARSAIGDVYYNRKEFDSAAREFNKILDKFPTDIKGHAGLLNTYVEISRETHDPRFVIARHRLIQKLGIESDLPMYLLTKLAGFYIDLNEDDLRIQYQVDPINSVNGMNIEDNATHLLELVFKKKEERDGETIVGTKYGEGFYQRGRFLSKQKEALRAVRQFQNAHQYDPRHYLAVQAIGSYYRDNFDFARAEEYFTKALQLNKEFKDDYGSRPEDETLAAGDRGLLYFDMGSLLFLKNAGMEHKQGFAQARIYPDRAERAETTASQKRREQLVQARDYFATALKEGLRDEKAKIQATYWTGWIDYVSSDFESALNEWGELPDIFKGNYSDPVLLMARANSYYYTDQTRSALGDYLKVQNDLERAVEGIDRAVPEDPKHQELFLTLAALYNNLAAVYEKEFWEARKRGANQRSQDELEKSALKFYWKSIESARQVDEDNEIARTNLQMAFRPVMRKKDPALDDWISPSLATLNEKKKKQ